MEENLYREGLAAAEAGDLKKAQQLFSLALQKNPKSEKTWLAMGRYVTDAQKKEFCFEKVLSLNPNNSTAQYLLAELREPEPEPKQELSFSEDELSGEWDESESDDLSEQWDSGEDRLEPKNVRETFFSTGELGGEWDESESEKEAVPIWADENEDDDWEIEEEASIAWDDKKEKSEPIWDKEEKESLFRLEDAPRGRDIQDELTSDWRDEDLWIEKKTSPDKVLRDKLISKEKSSLDEVPDIWRPEVDVEIAKKTYLEKIKDKRKDRKESGKKSCLAKIINIGLSLVVFFLAVSVALLAFIDFDNPPAIIEPILSTYIPTRAATETPTATEEAKTQPLVQLPPTWTLSPSPIPSSTPIPTQTLTATISANSMPIGMEDDEDTFIVVSGDAGWSRYTHAENGWGLAVPSDWVYLDLNTDDFDKMLSKMSRSIPALATMYSSDILEEMVSNDVKLLVVDTKAIEFGLITNLSILVTDLEASIDFDFYIKEHIRGLEQTFGENLQIAEERLNIGGINAAELIYEASVLGADGDPLDAVYTQYLLLKDEKEYILTFITPRNLFESKYPQITIIAQSFDLND